MTTVTTLKGEVSGKFPVLTKYGVMQYSELGQYLNAMDKWGYTFTTAQVAALTAFYKAGYDNGWIDKLLYVMPFIGNSNAYKAAAVPMIDRFSDYNPALIGASGQNFPFNDDYSKYFTVDGNDNVLSAVPYRTDMILVMNLSLYNLFVKTPESSNQNNGNYGIDWYGNFTTAGTLTRVCQALGFTVNNYLGFTVAGGMYREWFGRISSMASMGTAWQTGGARFYSENIKPNSQNILQYRGYNNQLSTIVSNNETANREDYNVLSDVELAKVCTWGINGGWNANTKSVGQVSLTSGLESRYIAFHDGTLGVDDEETYRPALRALFQAFSKLF